MIEQRPTVQNDMPNSGHYKNDRKRIMRRHQRMTAKTHPLHLQQVIFQTGNRKPLNAASEAANAL